MFFGQPIPFKVGGLGGEEETCMCPTRAARKEVGTVQGGKEDPGGQKPVSSHLSPISPLPWHLPPSFISTLDQPGYVLEYLEDGGEHRGMLVGMMLRSK